MGRIDIGICSTLCSMETRLTETMRDKCWRDQVYFKWAIESCAPQTIIGHVVLGEIAGIRGILSIPHLVS